MSQHAPTRDEAIEARKKEVEGHVDNHGHSVAAWTGVGIVLLGSFVAAVAMIIPIPWLVVTGIVIMPIGGLVGLFMGRRSSDSAGHASSDPDGQRGGRDSSR